MIWYLSFDSAAGNTPFDDFIFRESRGNPGFSFCMVSGPRTQISEAAPRKDAETARQKRSTAASAAKHHRKQQGKEKMPPTSGAMHNTQVIVYYISARKSRAFSFFKEIFLRRHDSAEIRCAAGNPTASLYFSPEMVYTIFYSCHAEKREFQQSDGILSATICQIHRNFPAQRDFSGPKLLLLRKNGTVSARRSNGRK